MADHGLSGSLWRARPRARVRVAGVRIAPDLVERDFNPTEPDRCWSADITEIPTWEGKLYLAHVQDLFSRRIVGWAMATHREGLDERAQAALRDVRDRSKANRPETRVR